MPPHRDWTRRGAGRALLYWPLAAFLLAAAFPALAVPLAVGSGVGLAVLGVLGGAIGKRWRALRLHRARRAAPRAAAPAVASAPSGAWPTGRHRRPALGGTDTPHGRAAHPHAA